jgi:hypothetical protein
LILYIILPHDAERPSSIFLQLHFVIIIIPILTLFGFKNESFVFVFWAVVFFGLEVMILKKSKRIRFYKIRNSRILLNIIIVVISIFVYVSMLRANGIPSLRALNFWNVYDIRSQVQYPYMMVYFVSWQAKIINPYLITKAYIDNNKINLIIALCMQLLLYLITAHKSFILIPIAIIIITKILEKYEFFKSLSFLSFIGVLGSYLMYLLFDIMVFPFLFIYRLLILPAQIKFSYYDFFSKNEYLYFSEGVIGKIFDLEYPYELNIQNLISKIYFGDVNSAANTGYIADAFANFGILGMFLMTLLLVAIFILIDSLSKNLGKEFVVGLSIFSILGLNDLGLLTTLLTGGLLLLLIILYLDNNSKIEIP